MIGRSHPYANFIETNRNNITWKPLPDNFDTRCTHIIERCHNTDSRFRTMTVSDVLAEIGRAVQSNWHKNKRSDASLNHNMSHVLEETTFDETCDNQNGSTVFSPGGSFNISTDDLEGAQFPRTSSPIQPSLPKYTDEEKREIWRKRVLLKRPILFNAYCNHRFPKKSYKYGHRQILRRKVIIDDPRCRTPTPTALKTSWTRFEDVIKQEGILSSPASMELIDFESHSQINSDESLSGLGEITENDLWDIPNVSYDREPPGVPGYDMHCPLSSSSEDYKTFQNEIITKVKKDLAEDNIYRGTSNSSQDDGGKECRSYWGRLTNNRQSFISRRTPRYKLARKKAQLLRSTRVNVVSPPEPEEATSSAYDLRSRGVNLNSNRNASGISTEHCMKVHVNESCRSQSANSSTASANGSFSDKANGRTKFQNSEQFRIPVVEPSSRRIPRKTKREYHALDEISEHNENDLGSRDQVGRCLCEETTSLNRSWSSNPNLIVIVPENPRPTSTQDKIQPNLRRSLSSPNIKSLTPPVFVENETQITRDEKDGGDDRTSLRNGNTDYVSLNFKDHMRGATHIHFTDASRNPKNFTFGAEKDVPQKGPNGASTKNGTSHNINNANECNFNFVAAERMSEIYNTHLSRNDSNNSNIFPGDPEKNQPHQKHEKHGEKMHFNNDRDQNVQRNPHLFQELNDPSFRGFGLNDKYHYYKETKEANTRHTTAKNGTQDRGACGRDSIQNENQKKNKSRQYPGHVENKHLGNHSYEQWRNDHKAHDNHTDCQCNDCNRQNAQSTCMLKRDNIVNRNTQQNLPKCDTQKNDNVLHERGHSRPILQGMRPSDEYRELNHGNDTNSIQKAANPPNARSDKIPPQMLYSARNSTPMPPRGPQYPPHGTLRFPYRRPLQFCGPRGPFRRMPPPIGLPLPFPPSLRFAMRRPPFLGMTPSHLPPPFLVPPMSSRVPRHFP